MGEAVTRVPKPDRARTAAEATPDLAGRKYVVEAIGTFFLTFTVVTGVLGGVAFTPLAAGAMLMVMAYAGAHISGGHYNPAVTAAVLWRGRIGIRDAVGYWIAQLAAGVVAALVARTVVVHVKASTLTLSGHSLVAAGVVELIYSFALCYVVLNVATSRDQRGNGFYGLAIGFTVAAGAFAVGGISGGSFNPAVTLGGAVGGIFAWPTLWVYVLVELAAGGLAGLAFLALNPADS
jgi:aquaporin Z